MNTALFYLYDVSNSQTHKKSKMVDSGEMGWRIEEVIIKG